MIKNCDGSILRKFDTQQDYLWLWNPSKGRSRGILVGARLEYFDVGSFKQGDYMIQLNLWDKQIKIKLNLLVVMEMLRKMEKFLSCLSCQTSALVAMNLCSLVGILTSSGMLRKGIQIMGFIDILDYSML